MTPTLKPNGILEYVEHHERCANASIALLKMSGDLEQARQQLAHLHANRNHLVKHHAAYGTGISAAEALTRCDAANADLVVAIQEVEAEKRFGASP